MTADPRTPNDDEIDADLIRHTQKVGRALVRVRRLARLNEEEMLDD